MPKLSIVIPCYNEAESLPKLVDEINRAVTRDDVEVVLVNDGSRDNSAQVLATLTQKSSCITVVSYEKNRGYGGAILSGLAVAKGTYIGWMHGDLQTPFVDALKALTRLEALGMPKDVYIKGWRTGRSLFDHFFTFGMGVFETFLFQKKMFDINAQPNIFHRDFFATWHNPPHDFALDLYAMCMARQHNLRTIRIPVAFPPRQYGHSHWNFGLGSRIKFIKRTLLFSLDLKKKLDGSLLPQGSFIKYFIAGSIAGLIHLVLLFIFTDVFKIYYLASTSLALFIVFWISFALQKYWTFAEHSTHRIKHQAVQYFAMHSVNFLTNGALMYLMVSVLGVWYLLSQVVVSLSIAVVTYAINKRFIFKPH